MMKYTWLLLLTVGLFVVGCDSDGDGDPDKTDCMPDDPEAHVAGTEVCEDGKDNDCDGDTDCCDRDCGGKSKPAACREVCGDGVDNDCDGETDENCTFTHVDAGGGGGCAINDLELPVCWGDAKELDGFSTDISAGNGTSCAMRKDGSFLCRGGGMAGNSPKGLEFSQVSAGTSFSCGIRKSDGGVECFAGGRMVFGQATFGKTKFDSVTVREAKADLTGYQQLDTSASHICGVRKNGSVVCWGNDDQGQCAAPRGKFTRVATGEGFSCAIDSAGEVTCWGEVPGDEGAIPAGPFERIAAGTGFACGLRAEGTAACWGDLAAPADVTLQTISAGTLHACGLTTEGGVHCWGACDEGQCDPNWN
jgi:Regulator of chromosome condensation (RCC1) repeat/Putative metal-binding motif